MGDDRRSQAARHPVHRRTRSCFSSIGGIEATIMRVQLTVPHNDLVSPQVFNRLFTMHGTTMVFFVGMPILFGFANYLRAADDRRARHGVPAAERLRFLADRSSAACCCTSASLGGDGLYGAGNAPDVGWFAYAPLTSQAFSRGHSTDYWTLALLVSGLRQHRHRGQHHHHRSSACAARA